MFGFPLIEFIYLVLGFGFLIFVHELGHFAVAKWVGIRCPQFAIGFGKAMFSYRKGIGIRRGSTEAEYEKRCTDKLKADGVTPAADGPHTGTARIDTDVIKEEHKSSYTGKQMFAVGDELGLGETEYRLNYLPLGGYVKMLGQEDMDPNAASDDPNAYNAQPIWARACVISAGVVMNMIFGAIFLAIAFMIGVEFPSATVGQVIPGMPAATTYAEEHEGDLRYLGLQEGDVITSVDGKTPEDFKDVAIAVALGTSDSTVELVVERRGLDAPLTFNLQPERQKTGEKMLSAGFTPGPGLRVGYQKEMGGPIVQWFEERTEAKPSSERGEGEGFRIAQVNGEPVESYGEYLLAFDQSGGKPVLVTLWDNAAPNASSAFEIAALPTLVRYPDKPANLLGLMPAGEITFVAEGSPAEKAKLKPNDILIKVGPLDWPTDTGAIAELVGSDPKAEHEIIVQRDGKTIELGKVKPDSDGKFGIIVSPAYNNTVIGGVLEDTPAEKLAGTDPFLPGTRITQINDTPVQNWADVQRVLQSIASQSAEKRPDAITLSYTLPIGQADPEQAVLPVSAKQFDELAAAGWQPDHESYLPLQELTLLKAEGLGDAMAIGLDKSQDFVLQTYITLLRLIQGNVKIYNLRGPVGIIDTGTTIAQQGLPYLLFFLGLISINLAVINFLPIPIVDGGHMVFLAWEKITGKPPSEKVQVYSLYAGLMVIGFVFIATFYFDVLRLITRFF
ncbi:MAG: site-2 protease family protein [Phycisphaeraceae bacterium]